MESIIHINTIEEMEIMTKDESIKLLSKQMDLIEEVKEMYRDPKFDKWKRDTAVIIENIFCEDKGKRYVAEFEEIRYSLGFFNATTPESSFKSAFQKGLDKAKVFLQSLIEEVERFGLGNDEIVTNHADAKKKAKLFISHSSLNRDFTDKFVMLLKRLGIRDEQIYYSSFVETGAEYLDDCFERITKEFRESELMIVFMLSREFYNSNVCLAEMGATWISEVKYIPIILPPLDFSDVKGVIKPTQNGIMLCDKELNQKLDGLKETIEKYLNITNKINLAEWNREKDAFISEIKRLSQQDKAITSSLKDINLESNKCVLKIEIKNNTRLRYRCEGLNIKLQIKDDRIIEMNIESWLISSMVLQAMETAIVFIEMEMEEKIKKSTIALDQSQIEVMCYQEA